MTTNIITTERPRFQVAVSAEAEALKEAALTTAALVCKVETDEQERAAVTAQQELDAVLKAVERSRKAAKEPVLEAGRAIDTTAAAFVAEVRQELTRVSKAVGEYVTLRDMRRREAERLAREDLSRIERERAEALAAASTHDQVDEVQERFDALAKAAAPPEEPRPEGQVIRHDWDIQITDIHALYRHHPNCVKLEPLVGEIKAILNGGGTVKGVKAERIVKAGVRQNRGAVIGV